MCITAQRQVPEMAHFHCIEFLLLLAPSCPLIIPHSHVAMIFSPCMPLIVLKDVSRRGKSLPIEIVTNQRDAVYAPPKKTTLVYDSVLTRALPLVTLTPICLARAMISMRLRAETA